MIVPRSEPAQIQIIRPTTEDEWHAARQADITASVVGALAGTHPYVSSFQLYCLKSGLVKPADIDNGALKRGRLLEPVIFEMLRQERPEWEVRYPLDLTYYRDPDARLGATPDAFASRPDIFGPGVIQGKTVHDREFRQNWVDPISKEIVLPLWIAIQTIVEADLTGASWAAVAAMVVGRGIDLYVLDVEIHAGIVAGVRHLVEQFWRSVDERTPPAIDWQRDSSTVLDPNREASPNRKDLSDQLELDDVLATYQADQRQKAAVEIRLEIGKAKILHALGKAEHGRTNTYDIHAPEQGGLVVRTCNSGQLESNRAARSAQVSIRCSQLSSTRSNLRPRSTSVRVSRRNLPG